MTSLHSAKLLAQRFSEHVHELRYGIRTSGLITPKALGHADPDALEYSAVSYAPLKRLLATVIPDPQKDIFIDWGCGMGRVLTLASTYPYREVIGVELSTPLCGLAEQNLRRARVKRVCGKVTIANADALEYPIPDNASVMFFASPFRGELLRRVVLRIRDSWLKHPRLVTLLVFNQSEFVRDTGSADWLRRESVRKEFPRASSCVIRSLWPAG